MFEFLFNKTINKDREISIKEEINNFLNNSILTEVKKEDFLRNRDYYFEVNIPSRTVKVFL